MWVRAEPAGRDSAVLRQEDRARRAPESPGSPSSHQPARTAQTGCTLSRKVVADIRSHHCAPEVPDLDVTDELPARLRPVHQGEGRRRSPSVRDATRSRSLSSTRAPLLVSDWIRGLVIFLNAGPSDHHIFGSITSTHRGFHRATASCVPSTRSPWGPAGNAKGRDTGWVLAVTPSARTSMSKAFHYNPAPSGPWDRRSLGSRRP
jgi:hypothetical protein